jgi:hypothetical protein
VPADLYWRSEKIQKGFATKKKIRRSTLNQRKTSRSHLFFALLSKPGIIFWIPGFILLCLSLLVFLITLVNIVSDFPSNISLYSALRNSMLNASLSWLTIAFSFLLGIQFFTLGFLTNQNKSNQEETYRTLHSIYAELKKERKN